MAGRRGRRKLEPGFEAAGLGTRTRDSRLGEPPTILIDKSQLHLNPSRTSPRVEREREGKKAADCPRPKGAPREPQGPSVAMAVSLSDMDAHEQPSDEMRSEWKYFAKLDPSTLPQQEPRIDDPRRPLSENGFRQAGQIGREQVARAFAELDPALAGLAEGDVPVIHHPLLPGMLGCFRLSLTFGEADQQTVLCCPLS